LSDADQPSEDAEKPLGDGPAHHRPAGRRYFLLLSLTTLGVVYGDIGTSVLYAVKECFHGPHAIAATPPNIYGVLSLIVWALILVISVKYLVFVLRANNRGEGGILALMSLVETRGRGRWALAAMGLFGAALLYGDGMITPAISVLSAVEGLEVAAPFLSAWVIPVTIAILIGLFILQSRGTAGVGVIFGPVMIVWFSTLAALGIYQIAQEPHVLLAVDPAHGISFFLRNGTHGFIILGSVFLVVTGGESLYADLGHFGARPIRLVWFTVVLPALLLNYFGQGALLLRNPGAAENPFFNLAPAWGRYPLVLVATVAACVASQAVISGAYSLTRQAVQLGYLPRLEIDHTSAREIGQIYVPGINWALMTACIGLVIGFRSSSALAAAYGVAVTTTMVITTLLLYFVAVEKWGWSRARAAALCALFLIIDLAFFGANIIKVPDGGWFPLVVAGLAFLLMTTWQRGRVVLSEKLREGSLSMELFLSSVAAHPPIRVPGIAVFMYRNPDGTPQALLHNLKHNKVLHQQVVLLTVVTEEIPHVPEEERATIDFLGHGIYRMSVRYGFMEDPDIPAVLARMSTRELSFSPSETTYFLGRETLIAAKRPSMPLWREYLFSWMNRNATSAAMYFRLPPNRVVELGAQIEL
jgi:KUP system potassium uptake protein